MTQQTEMVQGVQNFEELQSLGRKELVAMVMQYKAEDTDCLTEVKGNSKTEKLVEALASYLGFSPIIEEEVTAQVNKEITQAVEDQADVLDFGTDVPTLQSSLFEEPAEETDPVIEQIMAQENVSKEEAEEMNAEHLQDMEEQEADWKAQVEAQHPNIEVIMVTDKPQETTGNEEVDSVLAELGLDGLDFSTPEGEQAWLESDEAVAQTDEENANFVKVMEDFEKMKAKEEKKKAKRKASIPMDAPIPVRQYKNLTIGIFGNMLEPREEPFPEGHKFAGMMYEEIKLERFNPKAHEAFRKTKGNMMLLYTNVGATYLIALQNPDGSYDPILEAKNKGRGHLRCKQMANAMLVAYNEKNDQKVISGEEYQKLVDQIELLPINAEEAGL